MRVIRNINVFVLCLGVILSVCDVAYSQKERNDQDFVNAKRLVSDKLYDLAAEQFARYVVDYPNSPHRIEATFMIAESYLLDENHEGALKAYQHAAMEFPDDFRAVDALFKISECYLELGEKEKAIQSYLRIPVFYPAKESAPRALVRAAELLEESDSWTEVEDAASQVLQDYTDAPEVSKARLLHAQAIAKRGEYDNALAEVKIVEKSSKDANEIISAVYYQYEWMQKKGLRKEAKETRKRLLEISKGNEYAVKYIVKMSDIEKNIGNIDSAIKDLEYASKQNVNIEYSKIIAKRMLMLYVGEGKYKKATSLVAAIDINDLDNSYNIAYALIKEGEYSKAKEYYKRMLDDDEYCGMAADGLVKIAIYEGDTGSIETYYHDYADYISGNKDLYEKAIDVISKNDWKKGILFIGKWKEIWSRSNIADDVEKKELDLYIAGKEYRSAIEQAGRFVSEYQYSTFRNEVDGMRDALLEFYADDQQDAIARLGEIIVMMSQSDNDIDKKMATAEAMLAMNDFGNSMEIYKNIYEEKENNIDDRNKAIVKYSDTYEKYLLHKKYFGKITDNANKYYEYLQGIANDVDDNIKRRIENINIVIYDDVSKEGVIDTVYSIISTYPDIEYAQKAYYTLGKYHYAMGVDKEMKKEDDPALWYLKKFILEYGEGVERGPALAMLLKRYAQYGDSINTREVYETIKKHEYPEIVGSYVNMIEADLMKADEVIDEYYRICDKVYYNNKYDNMLEKIYNYLLLNAPDRMDVIEEDMCERKEDELWNERILYGNALMNSVKGEKKIARGFYREYLEKYPNGKYQREVRIELAKCAVEAKRYEEAEVLLNALFDGSKSEAEVEALRVKILFEKGDFENAKRTALAAEKKLTNKEALEVGRIAVSSAYKMQRLKEASKLKKAYVERYKGHSGLVEAEAEFLVEEGNVYSINKNYKASEKTYKKVINNYEDTKSATEASYLLGRDYLDQHEYEKGLAILTKMPKMYPGKPILGKVYWVLGNYYVESDNLMDAISTYERVIRDEVFKETWPYVYKNLINVYKKANLTAGALRTVKNYLEIYPESEDRFDKEMDLGLLYHQLGEYDLAISQFRKLKPMADIEDEAACQFYIAEALAKSGRIKEAVIEYKKVDYLGKKTKMQWAVTALYEAGRLLERMQESDKAVEMYKEILKREGVGSPFGRKANEQIERILQEG